MHYLSSKSDNVLVNNILRNIVYSPFKSFFYYKRFIDIQFRNPRKCTSHFDVLIQTNIFLTYGTSDWLFLIGIEVYIID